MTRQRPQLPPQAALLLDEFERPETLGASRQLGIAGRLLVALAEEHEGDGRSLLAAARGVVDYLSRRRGESSQAIPNALRLMVAGLDGRAGEDEATVSAGLAEQVARVDARLRADLERMVEHGMALVAGCRRLLAYDYSSSVAAILAEAAGQPGPPAVLVAEARPLDGGRRYLEHLAATGLRLELIPDAAIPQRIADCDLALLGAETISAQGDCYNTVGSLSVALGGREADVPVWVASTLIKIDLGTLDGGRRPLPGLSPGHLARLAAELGRGCDVAVTCPDLDLVPARLLAGYVTEVGPLPPAAIKGRALALAAKVNDA